MHYGNNSGNYTQAINVGKTTTATLSNLTQGSTHFVVVAAYTAAGLESLPSNEVAFAVASDPNPTSTPAPTARNALVNGSFENKYTAWTRSGNQKITRRAVTNGIKAVAFNGGDTNPSGLLSQTFATLVGQTYALSFDLGIDSYQSTDQNRIQVTVQGNSTVLSQTVILSGRGSERWYTPMSFNFVADGTSATLTFQDTSLVTTNIDLLLDNVNVLAFP